jgi:hypothetical protein
MKRSGQFFSYVAGLLVALILSVAHAEARDNTASTA